MIAAKTAGSVLSRFPRARLDAQAPGVCGTAARNADLLVVASSIWYRLAEAVRTCGQRRQSGKSDALCSPRQGATSGRPAPRADVFRRSA